MFCTRPRYNVSIYRIIGYILDWPGGSDVRIIHGRPRHPESQGLVERGHQLIQRRLAIAESEWLAANDTPFPWHKRLPFIQCKYCMP